MRGNPLEGSKEKVGASKRDHRSEAVAEGLLVRGADVVAGEVEAFQIAQIDGADQRAGTPAGDSVGFQVEPDQAREGFGASQCFDAAIVDAVEVQHELAE